MSRSRVKLVSVLVAVPLLFGVAACGDEGRVPQSRGALIDQMTKELTDQEDVTIDDDQARCVATAVVDGVGFERLRDELEDAGGSFEGISDQGTNEEFGMAMLEAMFECMDGLDGMFEEVEE